MNKSTLLVTVPIEQEQLTNLSNLAQDYQVVELENYQGDLDKFICQIKRDNCSSFT